MVDLHKADVLLLQEAVCKPSLQSPEWLSQRLGMAYVYARVNGHKLGIGFEEGLAILSRYPLFSPRVVRLGSGINPLVRRQVLGVEAVTPLGRLPLFSTHLGLVPPQNARQIQELQTWVESITSNQPAIIGGDFNAPENSTRIRGLQGQWIDLFRHLHPNGDGTTHELRWPWGGLLRRARLDYIFLKPGNTQWEFTDALLLENQDFPHSDHRAVLAELIRN